MEAQAERSDSPAIDDAVIVHQPIATAPLDGTPVRLIMKHGHVKWRTPALFAWRHGRWRAVKSGLVVSGAAEIVGWERVDENAG